MDVVHDIVIPAVCSFIACCALGVQFNIRMKHLIAASVGSVVSQLIYSLLELNGYSDMKCCFIAAAAVAAYSEIMARCFKAPVNMYLIVGIVPLVPGGLTYYTMLAVVMGDSETFLDRASAAFGAAAAIAMGIFAVSSVVRLGLDFYRQYKKKYRRAAGMLGSKTDKGIKKI